MAAHTYDLNAQGAVEGSNIGYQRITSTGAYTGVFTKAKAITAGTGATGIEFTFKSNEGAEAQYMSLYTHNKDGEEILGRKQLDSLMACVKARQIAPQPTRIMEWDNYQGKEVEVPVELYPALMNEPVGVVLQREEYRKNDGTTGERMNLHSFFNAETGQNGAEVIQKAPAAAIDNTVAGLRDKLLKSAGQGTTPTSAARQQQRQQGRASIKPAMTAAAQDFDDELPF